jgi:hypothetical protein
MLLLAPGTSSALAAGPYPPPVRGSAEVSQSRVQVGDCIIFSGRGFAAFTDVRITDNGKFLGTARTNAKGEFRFKVCFPSDSQIGRHVIRGTGTGAGGGQITVSATVIVEGRSEQPGNGNGGGDGNGGGLPFTGFVGAGLVVGSIALLAAGSLLVLVGGRSRKRTAGRNTLPA